MRATPESFASPLGAAGIFFDRCTINYYTQRVVSDLKDCKPDCCRIHALLVDAENGYTAGKKHHFPKGVRDDERSQTHNAGWSFQAVRSPALTDFRSMVEAVRFLERDGEAIIVRGETREGIDFEPIGDGWSGAQSMVNSRRREHDDKPSPSWKRCPQGRRWVMLDLDERDTPDWFPEDPSPEDLKQLVEDTRSGLPEPFRDVACYYQWSSSAGIDGYGDEDKKGTGRITWPKIKLHLWFWLDRPALSYVGDEKALIDHTIKGYFNRWNEGIEMGKIEGVKVDPSPFGAVHKHYVAPPVFEGTDESGEPMRDPLGCLRSGILEGDTDTVSLPDEILTPDRYFEIKALHDKREDRRRKDRRAKIDSGRLEVDEGDITATARAALEKACSDIRKSDEGNRHETMRDKTWWVYGFVNAGMLDDEQAEEALVAEYLEAKPEGEDDARRMIAGARDDAPPLDVTRYAKPTYTPPDDLTPPDERIDVESIDEGRQALARAVSDTVDREGVTIIKAAPGMGKSYAIRPEIIATLRAGGRVIYAAPTNDLADEIADELKSAVDDLDIGEAEKTILKKQEIRKRVTRNGDTCEEIGTYTAKGRTSPTAAIDFCMGCPLNIHNGGDCLHWDLREAQRGCRCEIMTHHVAAFEAERLEAPAEDRTVVVDWKKIGKTIGAGRPVRVVLRQTPMQHRITVETNPAGAVLEKFPTGLGTDTDTRKRWALECIAERLECAPFAENIAERLIALDRIRPDCELAIIDEDPWGAIKATGKITPEDLEQMRRDDEIEIDADDARVLGDLIASTKSGGTVKAEEIAEVIDAKAIEVCPAGTYPAAEGVETEEEALALRHYYALDGLRDVLDHDWSGAYIANGSLCVPFVRDVPWERLARSVVVLDATATPDAARALYGEDCHFVEIGYSPESTNVIHIPYSAAKNKAPGGDFKRERAHDIWLTTHAWWDSPSTVHLTHKAMKDSGTTGDHLAALEGEAIYFGGTQARGSNEFQDFDTIVVDSYFCHGGAIHSTAYALCRLAGDDWSNKDHCERWEYIARHSEETSEIVQAVHRVRPLLADRENPVRIIFLDERDPGNFAPEFSPDEKIDPDFLVAEILRIFRGDGDVTEFLRNSVENSPQKILIPALIGAQNWQEIAQNRTNACLVGARVGIDNIYNGRYLPMHPPNPRLANFCRDHFQNSWRDFAEAADLICTSIRTSEGGKNRVTISREEITPARLRESLESYDHDLQWVEIDGKRIDLVGVEDELREALQKIDRADFANMPARAIQRLVGAEIGVSAWTVRTSRLKAVGWTTADLIDAWREEHGIIPIERHDWYEYQPPAGIPDRLLPKTREYQAPKLICLPTVELPAQIHEKHYDRHHFDEGPPVTIEAPRRLAARSARI